MINELPSLIEKYVVASNRHDVMSIVACFSDDAVVHDEETERAGKEAIESWIVETIEKYKFQFKPLTTQGDDAEVAVTMEVSGTFPGSPVTLDYHFIIEAGKIVSLAIS